MADSGSCGSQRASRSRTTPKSSGILVRGPRFRVVADPACPSNTIFGPLAEEGKDSEIGVDASGTLFPASSPFFSTCFSKY